jgi:retron-type reverse transcriptase
MKRHGNLFEKIASAENLVLAYRDARRGKTWQRVVKTFDLDAAHGLERIRQSLVDGCFRTSSYRTKTIYEPKKRLVYILPFAPDRIVHHALMNVIEPIWEGLFIHDSYACRKGKGIHAGSRRTMEFVRRNRYCLQCDIAKFYPSMKHAIAYALVERKIKCSRTLALFRDIIYSPGGSANIPIGNYTSQWLGNLYLNEIDQYLKHVWKIRDYLRYCDDFLLFHNDKGLLSAMKDAIAHFLAERLQLTMSTCEVFPVSQGVDFLGYRHFPSHVLLRKSTAHRIMRRVRLLPELLNAGKITLDQFRSSIASISGWMQWAQTRHLAEKLRLPDLAEAFHA